MSSRGQSARPAFNRDTLPIAIDVLTWDRCVLERETHIIGNEKVEVPIPVVVKKTASRAPARLFVPQTGDLRHISKRAIPIVAIEPILTKVCTENIFESVVVVVANTDPR